MNWVSAYDGVSDPSTFAIYTSDGKIVFDPSLSKGDIKVYSLSYSMNNRTIGLAIFSSGNPEIMVVSKEPEDFTDFLNINKNQILEATGLSNDSRSGLVAILEGIERGGYYVQ